MQSMTIPGQAQYEATRVYHDFDSLNLLKAKGKDNNPEAIMEAARQFESIFVGMMLKSMRDANAAIADDPLFDSAQMGMYQDMYDEQLTLHLSSSNSGLGLAEILVQQLTGKSEKIEKESVPNEFNPVRVSRATSTNVASSQVLVSGQLTVNSQPIVPSQTIVNSQSITEVQPVATTQTSVNTQATKQSINADNKRGLDFSSPTAFVHSLWPYAKKAAKLLQLDPKILIAQAALETGWGQYVMRTELGDSSKNLFGIKANKSWSGQSTQINTLEFKSGSLTKQKAAFRTYDSYADSFADYADFISSKSRYQKAMNVTNQPENYVQELQAAGYATDPDYAKKIGTIYYSPVLTNAINALVNNP